MELDLQRTPQQSQIPRPITNSKPTTTKKKVQKRGAKRSSSQNMNEMNITGIPPRKMTQRNRLTPRALLHTYQNDFWQVTQAK